MFARTLIEKGPGLATLTAAVVAFGCGGCSGADATSVAVPLIKSNDDTTYFVGPTATVSSEEYDDDQRGTVVVQARRGRSTSNTTPRLSGRLSFRDGSSIQCSMFRSYVWSDFTNFMALNLRCDSDVDPAQATSFTIP